MINGVNTNNSIPSFGYVVNSSSNGKIALPVEPSSLVYSHLKHVSGVPAPEGSQGVNISKLNILDVLIDQVNQFRKIGNVSVSSPVSEDRQNLMIEIYRDQILAAREARNSMPYNQASSAPSGAIFKISI